MHKIRELQCACCFHLHPVKFGKGYTCNAFPAGIPSEIIRGDFIHTEPFPGDNRILYQEDLSDTTREELEELLDRNDEEILPYILRCAASDAETIGKDWVRSLLVRYINHENWMVQREAEDGLEELDRPKEEY